MVAWLEATGDDVPDNETLWGFDKPIYFCSDLKGWLEARRRRRRKSRLLPRKGRPVPRRCHRSQM